MREIDRQKKKKLVISFPSPSSLLPTENNMEAEELNLSPYMLNFAFTADYGFICLVACFSFESNTACQMWRHTPSVHRVSFKHLLSSSLTS